jgi:S1-C subfamily serine protease
MSKRGAPAAAILIVASLVSVAACGGSDKASTDEALSGRDLVANVRPSVVSILAVPPGETREPYEGGRHVHGTGVVYDARRGLVLTSSHYLEAAGSVRVEVNGTQVRGRPVARAQCNDFAVVALRPRPRGLTAIRFGDSSRMRAGDRVTAIGYLHPPTQKQPSLIRTDGTVSSPDVGGVVYPTLPPFPSLLLHQAPLQASMSGGALVNSRGELVGLDTFIPGGDRTESGPWEALPSNYIKKRLGELRPGGAHFYVGWEREHVRCHHALSMISDAVMKSHPKTAQPAQAAPPGMAQGGSS